MSTTDGVSKVLAGLCANGHDLRKEGKRGRNGWVCLTCGIAEAKSARKYDNRSREEKAAENAERATCVRGHDLTAEAKLNAQGRRICGACERENTKNYQQRKKADRNREAVPSHFGRRNRAVSLMNQRRAYMTQPAFVTSVEEFLRESERRRVVEAKNRLGGAR